MTAQTKTTLKTYFEAGDFPTQAQFEDLVDSLQLQNARLQAYVDATAPNADQLWFFDYSTGSFSFLTLGTGLSITGTTLNAATTSPAGAGTELQYRSGSSFAALTGSSVSGSDVSFGGIVTCSSSLDVISPTIGQNNWWRLRADGSDSVRIDSINHSAYMVLSTLEASFSGSLRAVKGMFSSVLSVGVFTFATLPSAASNTGSALRISDRSQKWAYSDGTDWRFFVDGAIVS